MPDGVQRAGGFDVHDGGGRVAALQLPEQSETPKLQFLQLGQPGRCVVHDLR